ncbi:hypothetical protein EPO05_02860 [Patescibacteria group bacterium]|nr:MAG: hypothetical protein EPO05_02860 [Patescibacteria group bacterium]
MQKNKKFIQLLPYLGVTLFSLPVQAATISFPNPTDYTTVQDLLGGILTTLQGTIVVISIIFIVIGALLYITSAGSAQIEKAKKAITASMIGLAIGVAAPALLKQIASIVGWAPTTTPTEYDDALTLLEISQNVLNFLLSIVGILSILMLVIGGVMYIAAGGSERSSETAKKIIMYSIVGIAVALSSLVIVRTIVGFFGS